MSNLWPQMSPGLSAPVVANFKALFLSRTEQFLAQGRYLSGDCSRDASNTVNVGVLQPGKILGKITTVVNSLGAVGLYAPSIYGLTNLAITSVASTVTLASTAIGTEILRRRGATGTVKITGPPTASGVVRTITVTYSAISTTTMTITPIGANEVQRVDFNIASTGGNVVLKIPKSDGTFVLTTPAAWSATDATYLSNIQTVLDVASGVANGIVVTAIPSVDTDLGFILTFSGTGYANLPAGGLVTVETLPTSSTAATVSRTTTGVDGRFVTGSLIQPTDGSENMLTIIDDWTPGVRVTDSDGASVTQVDFRCTVGGMLDTTQIIDFPADPSTRTYLEQQLSSLVGGKYVFGGTTGVF